MYKHKEAFCVMEYLCDDCFRKELLWNTRDGVTPFLIPCGSCGGLMSHVNWRNDSCKPHFQPPRFMRVFVDYTLHELILSIIRSSNGHNLTDAQIAEIAKERFKLGEPNIKVVDANYNI